jgi:hypothetical protein
MLLDLSIFRFLWNFLPQTGLAIFADYNLDCGDYDALSINSLRAQRSLPTECLPGKSFRIWVGDLTPIDAMSAY